MNTQSEAPLKAQQPSHQDGPINDGWQITVAHGHSGYGVYAHMEDYPEEGAVLVQAIEQPAQTNWNLVYLHSAMEYIREHHPQVYAECGDTDEFRADRLKEIEQPAQQQEPVAWMLEWTFNGEERGRRLYDDEAHCVFDAENDGGVCRPLYTSPPASKPWVGLTDEQKDAARWRFLVDNSFDKEGVTQFHVWEHSWEPHSQTGEPTEWKQRVRGPALDRFIDSAIEAKLREKNA